VQSSEGIRITRRQWKILAGLMAGVFLGALDISIISPALPVIAQKLSIQTRDISWIVTLYLLVYIVSTPLMSTLSDRFGRKKVYLLDVAVFGLGSIWAALSPSFPHLLVARGIQALGAGGLFPISNTLIGEVFPSQRRGMALGFIGMVWGVAAILGPLIGGWLTEWLGWTAIFYLNIPIAVIVLLYARSVLPMDSGVHEKAIDFIGMVLLGLGLIGLTYGLNQLQSPDLVASLLSTRVWPWLLSGILILILFVLFERNLEAPVISLSLFSRSRINIGLGLSLSGGVAEAGIVFIPFYAGAALGIKVGETGTLILASAITLFLFTEPMGRMVDRIGAKPVLLFGTAITALGAVLMTRANSLWSFIGYQVILGLGLSALLGAPVRYVVLSETGSMERASAQSLVSLVSSFGTMIGSTLAGAFLASYPNSLTGFHEIYLTVGVVAGIAFLLTFGLRSKSQVESVFHQQPHHE
jgi:EmrB/QacA subfamily drug resistance transporter